jgi:hypothetical protein
VVRVRQWTDRLSPAAGALTREQFLDALEEQGDCLVFPKERAKVRFGARVIRPMHLYFLLKEERELRKGSNVFPLCKTPGCVSHYKEATLKKWMRHRHQMDPNLGFGASKLTAHSVRKILRECGNGRPQAEVARDFGVSRQMVNAIVKGKKWGRIKRSPSKLVQS